MTDIKTAWTEVGDRLEALGLKLKLHAEEELAADGAAVHSAFGKVADSVKDAFDALGDACQDGAVRDDVRATGEAIAEAFRASVAEVRASLRSKA